MAIRRPKPEEIVVKLRQVEVLERLNNAPAWPFQSDFDLGGRVRLSSDDFATLFAAIALSLTDSTCHAISRLRTR